MTPEYEIRLLNLQEAESFKNMTYGLYKPFIAWMNNVLGKVFAVGLFCNGMPAGLLLGLYLSAADRTDLLSIFIEKEHRGQRISCEMMRFLEEKCREAGIVQLRLLYYDNRSYVPLVKKLLDSCGFYAPEPEVFMCRCDESFTNLPLIEFTELPTGFETFQWSELTHEYKETLKNRWENEPWFDKALSPFQDEETIVSEISLGLRKDDRIIGWTICNYREKDKTIVYTSIFIMPEFQGTTLGIALQMRSIRGHLLSSLKEKYPYALFQVRYDNTARLKVVKKKFAKFAVEQFNQVIRKKLL